VLDCRTPPGLGPPPHIHRNKDEIFLVQSGSLSCFCGGGLASGELEVLSSCRRAVAYLRSQPVPALSALLAALPASPRSDRTELLPACCDNPAKRIYTSFSFQRLTEHWRTDVSTTWGCPRRIESDLDWPVGKLSVRN